MRVYCVGDIHGRNDLLCEMLGLVEFHKRHYTGDVKYVFLGDYIDRGEDSKKVLDTLIDFGRMHDGVCFLRGNHEQVLLDFLQDPLVAKNWLVYGGIDTLISYNVPVRKMPSVEGDFRELQKGLMQKIPPAHLKFLRSCELFFELGNCFFVHAGISPDVPLQEQREEDLLWIKDEFVRSNQKYSKLIVHGHSIEDEPVVNHNRIGLDTGAYVTGKLTCGVFEGDHIEFLTTTATH